MGKKKEKIDLVGKKFGRLTVVEDTGRRKWGYVVWLCECVCGEEREIISNSLLQGNTKSCGCLRRDIGFTKNLQHGDGRRGKRPRIYRIWQAMLNRCYNENNKSFCWYGGKGIRVCQEWRKYLPFKRWAEKNGYKNDLTIDRIDNSGHYEPSNCQFITQSENSKKMIKSAKRNRYGVFEKRKEA